MSKPAPNRAPSEGVLYVLLTVNWALSERQTKCLPPLGVNYLDAMSLPETDR